MAALHPDCTPGLRYADRVLGLSRTVAAVGVLAVLALPAVAGWHHRVMRCRYEGRLRALKHELELTREAAGRSYGEGVSAGIEAARLEIQAPAEGATAGRVADVFLLRPRRPGASPRAIQARPRGPAAGA